MTDVDGSVAVVTGGRRGLGRAVVQALLDRGARTVFATARSPRPSDDPRVEPVALEVTDPASVAALARRAAEATIVVNNAGTLHPGSLLTADVADVRDTLETNVIGPLRVAQAFAPVLAGNGGGTLVDLHSVFSWAPGAGAYGASKAAFWSLTNSLRLELAEQGTQVIGVHLGFADTDMTARLPVPKIAPDVVGRVIVDAIRDGRPEVLVDDASRRVKSALCGPVERLVMGSGG